MADAASTTTFTSTGFRRSKAVACGVVLGLIVLLLFQMAKDPTRLTEGYMVAVGAVGVVLVVGLVRAFRVGIELNDDGVVARALYSTRSFRWGELAEAQSKDRAILGTGRALIPRSTKALERIQVVPQLRLTSGQLVPLSGLQVNIPSDEVSNWLDDAMGEINQRLKAQRQAPGPNAPPTPS